MHGAAPSGSGHSRQLRPAGDGADRSGAADEDQLADARLRPGPGHRDHGLARPDSGLTLHHPAPGVHTAKRPRGCGLSAQRQAEPQRGRGRQLRSLRSRGHAGTRTVIRSLPIRDSNLNPLPWTWGSGGGAEPQAPRSGHGPKDLLELRLQCLGPRRPGPKPAPLSISSPGISPSVSLAMPTKLRLAHF